MAKSVINKAIDNPIMNKTTSSDINSSEGPVLKSPSNNKPWYRQIVPFFLVPIMILVSPYFIYLMLFNEGIKDIIRKVRTKKSVKDNDIYKDKDLIKKLWASQIGKLYFNAVEYQTAEGYCANTTIRCVLKSIPQINTEDIPQIKSGASTPVGVTKVFENHAYGKIKSRILDCNNISYDDFLIYLKMSNDPKNRISANFLRSALFGYSLPKWNPMNFFLTLFGGHFSPILGCFKHNNNDVVAIFDVNHRYGLYFVPAERIYDAVTTRDIHGPCRALVLTEII